MMPVLHMLVETINVCGKSFHGFARVMFVQVTVLVGLLLALDFLLRRCRRVSPCLRYGLWLLVLVKLVLPPSLALPTGVGYWIMPKVPAARPVRVETPNRPVIDGSNSDTLSFRRNAGPTGGSAAMTEAGKRPQVFLQWQGALFLLWLTVVAWLLVQLLNRYQAMRREIHRAQPASNWLLTQMAQCQTLLGIRKPVVLRLSPDVPGPVICGLRRPVLLLPAFLPDRLSPEELKAVLGHELIHVRRRDTWVNLAQSLLQILYFYHPLVWVANHITARVRELAVDETVLAALKLKVTQYTATLIRVAEMAYRRSVPNVCFVGLAESREALKERITHMLRHENSERVRPGWVGLMVIVAVGAILVPMGRGQTDPDPQVPALPEGIAALFELDAGGVLQAFGEPPRIFYGDQRYTLDDLPETYFLAYDDLSFCIDDDAVVGITLLNPRYVFGNGVRVGDTEEDVVAAFGQEYTIREFEIKDFLQYDRLGLMFEIYKPERIAREINIERDYGDPARLQAHADDAEFAGLLSQRVAQLDIDGANRQQVIDLFGQPIKYIWGHKVLDPDQLPRHYIMMYPAGFCVFMRGDRIVEIRHEQESGFVFQGGIRIGSTVDEVLGVLDAPREVAEGKENTFAENTLFRDIGGRAGLCYYHVPEAHVRLFFADNKVTAIYMTRSDYYDGPSSTTSDPEFARLLPARIAQLDIDAADLETVRDLFGEPQEYVWGEKSFPAEALPERFIAIYPNGFRVFMSDGHIVELRFEGGGSNYVFEGLQVGSTLDEVMAVLGEPDTIVEGEKNAFADRVLYRDISGRRGHCYYHCADHQVRLWFLDYKVIAIYLTRSDYPTN